MADNEDMEYNLNGDNLDDYNVPKGGSNWPKPAKIILIIFIIICIVLAIALTTFIILYKNKSSDNSMKDPEQSTPSDPSEKQEPIKNITRKDTKIIDLFNFFGQNYSNLNYDNNGIIINTFKKGGDNYNESMGVINGGNNAVLSTQPLLGQHAQQPLLPALQPSHSLPRQSPPTAPTPMIIKPAS